MISFLIRRLVWMAITLWVVFTLSWLLMRFVPGGPLDTERQLEPHVRANIEAKYRLDQPLWKQYTYHLGLTLSGDLGLSFRMGDFSVNEIIAQGFPVSASLGILALTFALTLGLTAGIISAIRRQTVIDVSLMSVATIGIALPNFVIAGIAIIPLCFMLRVLPPAGWGELSNVVLPAFCLGAPYAAYVARLVRTGMLDVLNQDYIRTAYAKGLSSREVIIKHALKGAMLPVASFLGPAIAGILTGSLIVEQIFAIPGLGVHFVKAAILRDYTMAMGMVLVYTTLLYTMNLIVDISYCFFDPRVKLE
ncbi:MAG: ABC transporter permease subunit [Pirellulaceae bacterium]|nr:ABC transporter permease subunit [Pirellulaceae bacterium]MDP7019845.1 ABC transporter permease subunit [Pirellulaceae bacterium]